MKKDIRVELLATDLAVTYAKENYRDKDGKQIQHVWRHSAGNKADTPSLDADGKPIDGTRFRDVGDVSLDEAAKKIVEVKGLGLDKISEVKRNLTNLAGSFKEYSEPWKEANRGAARFLVSLLDKYGAEYIRNHENANEIGSLIHDDWMERNSWEAENPDRKHLFVDFDKLPEEEKIKDLQQLSALIKIMDKIQSMSAADLVDAANEYNVDLLEPPNDSILAECSQNRVKKSFKL